MENKILNQLISLANNKLSLSKHNRHREVFSVIKLQLKLESDKGFLANNLNLWAVICLEGLIKLSLQLED